MMVLSRNVLNSLAGLALLASMAGLVACANGAAQTKTSNAEACQLPDTKLVDAAFSEVRNKLSNTECQSRYAEYYQKLLEVAGGDQGSENRDRFFEFLKWSYKQGIISRHQAESYFTRYFRVEFVSLPDDRNVCSAMDGSRESSLLGKLDQEMRDKNTGLLDIVGDKDAYFDAKRRYDSIVLVLQTTASACKSGNRSL